MPAEVQWALPREGMPVGEYILNYTDGTSTAQPVRARFEVAMAESPGQPWLAMPGIMPETADPAKPNGEVSWGFMQYGIKPGTFAVGSPFLLYALPNPHPEKSVKSLTIRGLRQSPLIVGAITAFHGTAHPLAHLPRRTYRVKTDGGPAKIEKAEVDLGTVTRIEKTQGPRDNVWLKSQYVGVALPPEPDRGGEDLLEIVGAPDAAVSVTLKDAKAPLRFSLGEAYTKGKSAGKGGTLEVLGRTRQWMQVTVTDSSTPKPTPVRIHFSGARGEYYAPYGHHQQVNTNWFEDYGADVVLAGRSYAYVPGAFTTDLPVGEVYVEICKGFEYTPVRRKVAIRPGQKTLELSIDRWKDLRREGWVTADTHVHFISPHTAWLEGQCEGVNVVNLLASQWGRLFTNTGDVSGRVGIVEDDTVVYVGTENRNHMLGHISMLGTEGPPVYPMCGGGPSESWIGDPDYLTMAEWARMNREKNGVVIRPHFPYCGYTEDPVPIILGLVDALEIASLRGEDFPVQEWYRYLNCGYRVAVAGGTDKMSAAMAIGLIRTYAKLDPQRPFSYDAWKQAVRAGRTFSSTGPLIDMRVDGQEIGDTIKMRAGGATVEVQAVAESFWPLGKLEVVFNGQVVASTHASKGAKRLEVNERVAVTGTGWLAARCSGLPGHPGGYVAAHTSPIYLVCKGVKAFDGPAAEHMLALTRGGIEYIETISTVFDEAARKRMVGVYNEVRRELEARLMGSELPR
jgi:hypothetical protein